MLVNFKFNAALWKLSLPAVSLSVLFLFTQIFLTAACSSGELTRAHAQKLIIDSKDFKQPAVIEFIQGNIAIGRNKGAVESKSDNEPETEAVERRVASHYAANPQMGVAAHFGLIEAQVKRTNDKPEPFTVASSYWFFDERYVITEKARKMWEQFALPVSETSVPTAEKEMIEVTGITKQSDSLIQVDYNWRWNPNDIGKSLDTSTEEYKRLREKLKNDLLAPEGLKSKNQTLSWNGVQKATAKIQKYDDGWRIVSVF